MIRGGADPSAARSEPGRMQWPLRNGAPPLGVTCEAATREGRNVPALQCERTARVPLDGFGLRKPAPQPAVPVGTAGDYRASVGLHQSGYHRPTLRRGFAQVQSGRRRSRQPDARPAPERPTGPRRLRPVAPGTKVAFQHQSRPGGRSWSRSCHRPERCRRPDWFPDRI
jgi:hypothetical protein